MKKDITREEFSEMLKNPPYSKELKEFLEKATSEWAAKVLEPLEKWGVSPPKCKINENGIGEWENQ